MDLVINIPKSHKKEELEFGSKVRIAALNEGCPLVTNMEKAICFLTSMARKDFQLVHRPVRLSGMDSVTAEQQSFIGQIKNRVNRAYNNLV